MKTKNAFTSTLCVYIEIYFKNTNSVSLFVKDVNSWGRSTHEI